MFYVTWGPASGCEDHKKWLNPSVFIWNVEEGTVVEECDKLKSRR